AVAVAARPAIRQADHPRRTGLRMSGDLRGGASAWGGRATAVGVLWDRPTFIPGGRPARKVPRRSPRGLALSRAGPAATGPAVGCRKGRWLRFVTAPTARPARRK